MGFYVTYVSERTYWWQVIDITTLYVVIFIFITEVLYGVL